MAELTLESLAARVEALEKRLDPDVSPGSKHRFVVRPGTGDWEAAFKAIRELKDYDFDAIPEMDAASIEDLKRTQERWG